MDAMQKAAERRARQNAKRMRDWYRSLMYCGEPGLCGGECRVCRHYAFEEYVSAVAPRDVPCTVSYNRDVLSYIQRNSI